MATDDHFVVHQELDDSRDNSQDDSRDDFEAEQPAWLPREESQKSTHEHLLEELTEPDHGRHAIDRSRPNTIVRKNR